MSKFTVHLDGTASAFVTVEAEDYDEAMEKAYDDTPSGLCAHCSGYWTEKWGLELPGEWRAYLVTDKAGDTVYNADEAVSDGD